MKKYFLIPLIFIVTSLFSENAAIVINSNSAEDHSSSLMGNLFDSLEYNTTRIDSAKISDLKSWYSNQASSLSDISTLVLYYNGKIIEESNMKYLDLGERLSYRKLINTLLDTGADEIIVLMDSVNPQSVKPLVKIEGKGTDRRKIVFTESESPLIEDAGNSYSQFSYYFAQNATVPWTELFVLLGERRKALSEPIFINRGFELSFASLLDKDTLVKDLIDEAIADDTLDIEPKEEIVEAEPKEIVKQEEEVSTSNITTFEDDQKALDDKRSIKPSRIVGGLAMGAVATACFLSPLYLQNDTQGGEITMYATGGVFSVLGVIEIIRGFVGN